MRQIVDCAKIGWEVKVEGNLFIFKYPGHEGYKFQNLGRYHRRLYF